MFQIKNCITILIYIFLLQVDISHAQPVIKSTGDSDINFYGNKNKVTKVNHPITSGDESVTVSNSYVGELKYNKTVMSKVNHDLEQAQFNLLIDQNPTIINAKNISIGNWVNINDNTFDIEISNTSERTAKNIEVYFMDKKSNPHKFSPIIFKNYSLRGGETQKLPFATIGNIIKILNIKSKEILFINMSPNIGLDCMNYFSENTKNENCEKIKNITYEASPARAMIRYSDIFGFHHENIFTFFIYMR